MPFGERVALAGAVPWCSTGCRATRAPGDGAPGDAVPGAGASGPAARSARRAPRPVRSPGGRTHGGGVGAGVAPAFPGGGAGWSCAARRL
ncbi:hypothetical protein ATKI12_3296 [Kitasatospora sp. Ki12]